MYESSVTVIQVTLTLRIVTLQRMSGRFGRWMARAQMGDV
jgi:transposase-like protein